MPFSAKKIFGLHGLGLTDQVLRAWRASQHGAARPRTTQPRDRADQTAPIHTELRQVLEDASPKSRRTRWHRRFANNLFKVRPALWTFTTISEFEPTNIPAERAL